MNAVSLIKTIDNYSILTVFHQDKSYIAMTY